MNRRDLLAIIPFLPAAIVRKHPDVTNQTDRMRELISAYGQMPIAETPTLLADLTWRIEKLEREKASIGT